MAVSSNNVYVHSSPPKAISGQGVAIRQWVRAGDLEKLEQVILDGQGARLLGLIDTTAEPKVKVFLRAVPAYMAKVDLIHDAVIRGSLRETQALLDKRKLATGRDAVGRGLLHKAVLYNHKAVIEWLGKKYPETLHIKDNEARTALHYVAVSKDPDELYAQLMKLGAKETIDIHGRKPNYYINHPENLDIEGPRSLSNSRIKRPRLESTPSSKPISSTITRAQIRIWIHERDVGKLEKIVWSGHGDKLLLETTNNAKVKKFLLNVPHLLSKIKSIHSAAINNDVEAIKEIRSKTEIPEVFTAKDSHGLTALHKASGLGHRTVVEWFLYEFPNQLINDQDNDGRTPLHYSAKEPSTYNFLVKSGASEAIIDNRGKTPAYYKRNVADLDGRHLRNVPDAPRVTGELTPWDRVVTSPGAILDQKRRISNGEFNDEPHHQPPEPKKTIYDSDGYNGDTEGKYEIPDDIGHFQVEDAAGQLVEDDDDFEPPVNDDDEFEPPPLKNGNDENVLEMARETTPDDDSLPDLTPPPTQQNSTSLEQQQAEEPPEQELEPQEEFEEEVKETQPETNEIVQEDPEPSTIGPLTESDQAGEDSTVDETHTESQVEADEELGGGITEEQMEDNFIDDTEETAEDSGQDSNIDAEDMEKLVELVLDGKGNELLNIKSRNPEVQEFITNIPAYMAKIASIHAAAGSGNLRDLQTILDRKRLALAKDPNGLVPLHKAVLNGHSKVVRYLASNYNQSINVRDNNGRTPLHYAATLSDSGVTYKALIGAGADPNIKDVSGNTPGIYLRNKDLLSHADLTRAITNSVMIPSAVIRKHAETWQRPPSGNHKQLRSTNPVSQKTLELLKEAYKNLIQEESIWARILNRLTNQNRSHIPREYIQKYLTPQVFSSLSERTTVLGATLLDVIKYYPQAFIVAPDAHSYTIFKELFNPVIADHAKHFSPIHPKLHITGESQFPAIWSEEGKYLASVLGDALVKGLTQVSQERPEDPVEYLANFLRKYGKDDRPLSPAYEEDNIAQAAAAATVTSMALHHSDALPEVEEQTEEPTTEDPDTSDEPVEQTSDEPGNETATEALADEEATQGEEETEAETDTQGEVHAEEKETANVVEEQPPSNDTEEPMEQGEPPEEPPPETEVAEAMEEQSEKPEETPEDTVPQQSEPNEESNPEKTDATEDANTAEDATGNDDPIDVENLNDKEDAEMLKRLEAEVEEQNAEEQDDEDAIQTHEEPMGEEEIEIEGAGQRDERGQSVLHFAAARPGGSQTLLAFLHNPTVNLAWRDERMKTARDVASSLNRSENLQTIDSYVIGKAVSGDLETLQKLLSDGYDHLVGIEETNKNNIIELAEKAGQEKVVDFLKSVPQFQEKLDKLMDGIRVGDLERVKEFLQNDPALALATGRNGRTPLHVAVLCEEHNIVQYIAQNFPSALRRGDNLERTALHYAMGVEKVEKMTRILVRMGAKRVLKDIRGRQPSYYFINREEIAILQEEEKST